MRCNHPINRLKSCGIVRYFNFFAIKFIKKFENPIDKANGLWYTQCHQKHTAGNNTPQINPAPKKYL